MPPPDPTPLVRVLIVDDTAFYRRILRESVAGLSGVEVVGTASNGRLALAKLECVEADFVILDIEMPELNGLETLAQIRRRWPEKGVVIVSGTDRSAAEMTVEALSRGALDFVAKGQAGSAEESYAELRQSLRSVIHTYRASRRVAATPAATDTPVVAALARPTAHLARGPGLRSPTPVPLSERRRRADWKVDAVGIAASTGGPQLLSQVIPLLPADLAVPVFLVQHMLPAFTSALARSLDRISGLAVCEAQDRQPVEPGVVYVAPGGRHMVVRSGAAGGGSPRLTIGINDGPPENGCRPSADVLFRSLAAAYQGNVLALVTTGMGHDGTAGVRAIKQRGGACLTQNADSCVVYGMPRAVVDAGLSDEVLAPAFIAPRVAELVGGVLPPD